MSELDRLIAELCPYGVEYRALGECCRLSAGGDVPKESFSKEQTDEYNVPIYSNGIGDNALYGWTNKAKIIESCVTIAARGTIGYSELREKPFVPIIRLICAIPNDDVDVKYLKYSVETISFQVPTSGIPQLTVPMASKYKIPLPPLPVQRGIVRILDNFTELIAELTAELEARKKQYEYYSGELLANCKEHAQSVELGSVVDMKAGKFIQAVEISQVQDAEYRYPCYGGNGLRGYVKSYNHDGEYLLIGRQGALCGNVKRANVKFYATEHAVVVDTGATVNVDWLFHMLTRMNLNQYASKSAQPGLAVGNIAKLEISLPPLVQQERIADILDRFDTLTTDMSNGLPAEIEARRKQYEYYRDKLLRFEGAKAIASV